MIEAVRNLHALGVPLEDAIAAASAVPRPRARRRRDRAGSTSACRRTSSCSTTTSDIARVLVGGEVHVAV
jgi:hypothetical protein